MGDTDWAYFDFYFSCADNEITSETDYDFPVNLGATETYSLNVGLNVDGLSAGFTDKWQSDNLYYKIWFNASP